MNKIYLILAIEAKICNYGNLANSNYLINATIGKTYQKNQSMLHCEDIQYYANLVKILIAYATCEVRFGASFF